MQEVPDLVVTEPPKGIKACLQAMIQAYSLTLFRKIEM